MIKKETLIKELIDKHPETIEVLRGYGLNCVGCPSAAHETLENGLKVHGMDHEIELVLRDLNKVIEKD